MEYLYIHIYVNIKYHHLGLKKLFASAVTNMACVLYIWTRSTVILM